MGDTHDTATKQGPGLRPGVIRMPIGEPSVGSPHNLLQFPELGEETRRAVVDLLRIGGDCHITG